MATPQDSLLHLISSEGEDKSIAKTLISEFSKNPNLLGQTFYNSRRTLFHVLVLRGQAGLIEAIFQENKLVNAPKFKESELFNKMAAARDHKGNSVLHYAVRGNVAPLETLKTIIKYLPGLLNLKNRSGNTVLHEAALSKQYWALEFLIKECEADYSIKNSAGKACFDLINDQDRAQILKKLPTWLKSLDLRPEEFNPDRAANFNASYPLLTNNKQANHPSSSLQHLQFTKSLQSLQPKEHGEMFSTPRAGKTEIALRDLAASYKHKKDGRKYKALLDQFVSTCQIQDVSFIKQDSDSVDFKEILVDILAQLSSLLQKKWSEIQDKNYHLHEKFSHLLIQNGILTGRTTKDPNFQEINEKNTDLLRSLWLLTSCLELTESQAEREFSFEKVANRALGLLSMYSFKDIANSLRELYQYFDQSQKLVANYALWQVLNYTVINHPSAAIELNLQLKLFFKRNERGLGQLGNQINGFFGELVTPYTNSSYQTLQRNFHRLSESIDNYNFHQQSQSFEYLVERAISTKRSRKKEVQLIAWELKLLVLGFYQKISIYEFNNLNWSKEDKKHLAPHIVEYTNNFDKLSNYFVRKILTQSNDNRENALQFLVELAQEICPLSGEEYPDLNGLMLVSSVFNSSAISRLESFKTLSPKDKDLIGEINGIVDTKKNSQAMREVSRLYSTSLPHVNSFLKWITFAYEGNQNSVSLAEGVGKNLLKILKAKLVSNYLLTRYQTNLRMFLLEYKPLDWDELYNYSVRLEPRAQDVINLDDCSDFASMLEDLNKNHLDNNLLPWVILNKETFSPRKLIMKLNEKFTQIIKNIRRENTPLFGSENKQISDTKKLRKILAQLRMVIEKSTQIYNQHYCPKSSKQMDLAFYIKQTQKHDAKIRELEPLDSDECLKKNNTLSI